MARKGYMKRTRCPNCTNGYRGGYRPMEVTDDKGKKRVEQVWCNDLPCSACDSSGSLSVWVEE